MNGKLLRMIISLDVQVTGHLAECSMHGCMKKSRIQHQRKNLDQSDCHSDDYRNFEEKRGVNIDMIKVQSAAVVGPTLTTYYTVG